MNPIITGGIIAVILLVGGFFVLNGERADDGTLPKVPQPIRAQDEDPQTHSDENGITHTHPHEDMPAGPTGGAGSGSDTTQFASGDTETIGGLSVPPSNFFGNYSINDSRYGTDVTVTVTGSARTIVSNALPNHQTGTFPNSGNPNAISAQSNTYNFPATGTYTGNATTAREPGVAVNGIKFEPTTAEMVQCSSGERYQIEAFQESYDLGFDFNDAHVQPDGTYHYHGFPTALVDLYDDGSDLVHIGFAADGFMIYYDTTGTVKPSWELSSSARSGTSCTYRNQTLSINGSAPDGTFVSDWEYNPSVGNLDACNGATIGGEYAYFVTRAYPFVSRCLQGSFTSTGGPGGGTPPSGGTGPTGGQQTGTPGTPPQEAITACQGKSEGATCSMGPNNGTCRNTPDGSFACVP